MDTDKTAVEPAAVEKHELIHLVYRDEALQGGQTALVPFAFLLCGPDEVRFTWLVEHKIFDLGLSPEDYEDMTESLEMLASRLCSSDRCEDGDASIALDATSGFGDVKVSHTETVELTPEGVNERANQEAVGLWRAYMRCWSSRCTDMDALLQKIGEVDETVQSKCMDKPRSNAAEPCYS